MSKQPSDSDVLRFRGSFPSMAVIPSAAMVGSVALGIFGISAGVVHAGAGAVVLGIVFIAIGMPGVLLIGVELRSNALSTTFLGVPTMTGRRAIELAEVADIGVIRQAGRSIRWVLIVYSTHGRQTALGTMRASLGKRWERDLAPGVLSSSRLGVAANAIYQRSQAVQGSTGPLCRQPLSKRFRRDRLIKAYWTPGEGVVRLDTETK